tara:strand:+ start:514 stop:654 length:141 start_codon:yes stop_codon:yes gene_type:complete
MSKEEYEAHHALLKSFRERVLQLRMYDGEVDDFEDEEPDIFIGDGL